MQNDQILEEVRRIRNHSVAYQKAYGADNSGIRDEIGGHVEYDRSEHRARVRASNEYLTALFEECAAGLGFQYEQR